MEDTSRAAKLHVQRVDAIRRWTESDTAKASDTRPLSNFKIKFEDGAMLLAAVTSGDITETIRILDLNADVNYSNVDGLTSLHQACIDENLSMVKLLVERGASINACDNEGWTPLHAAATTTSLEIIKYLVEKGASITAVNSEGELPMDLSDDQKIRSYLEKELNNRNVSLEEARMVEHKLLLDDALRWQQQGFISDTRDKQGATAIHVAASKDYMDVVRILLSIGVDVDCVDNDGWTPLHVAVYWKHQDICDALFEANANVYAKNNSGQTIFDIADEDMAPYIRTLARKFKIPQEEASTQSGIYSTKPSSMNSFSSVSSKTKSNPVGIIKLPKQQQSLTFEAKLNKPVAITCQSKPILSSMNISKPPATIHNSIADPVKKILTPSNTSYVGPVIPHPPLSISLKDKEGSENQKNSLKPMGVIFPPKPSDKIRSVDDNKKVENSAVPPSNEIEASSTKDSVISTQTIKPTLNHPPTIARPPLKSISKPDDNIKTSTTTGKESISSETNIPSDYSTKKESVACYQSTPTKTSISDVSNNVELRLAYEQIAKLKMQNDILSKERETLKSTIEKLETENKNYNKVIEENKRLTLENSSLTKVITSNSRIPNTRNDRPSSNQM